MGSKYDALWEERRCVLQRMLAEAMEGHPVPSNVEWLTPLRFVLDELERVVRQIERRSARCLVREPRVARPEHCCRLDSGLRRALL